MKIVEFVYTRKSNGEVLIMGTATAEHYTRKRNIQILNDTGTPVTYRELEFHEEVSDDGT